MRWGGQLADDDQNLGECIFENGKMKSRKAGNIIRFKTWRKGIVPMKYGVRLTRIYFLFTTFFF